MGARLLSAHWSAAAPAAAPAPGSPAHRQANGLPTDHQTQSHNRRSPVSIFQEPPGIQIGQGPGAQPKGTGAKGP
eukprot:5831759-Pyramimonas_sp.AAC.1